VIAFYIVEKGCSYEGHCTKAYLEEELDNETIKKDEVTKQKIIDSFYGYTTWEDISRALLISFPK